MNLETEELTWKQAMVTWKHELNVISNISMVP